MHVTKKKRVNPWENNIHSSPSQVYYLAPLSNNHCINISVTRGKGDFTEVDYIKIALTLLITYIVQISSIQLIYLS